ELFSLLPFFRSRPPRYSSSDWRNQEGFSTRKLIASVFAQAGPFADIRSGVMDTIRSSPTGCASRPTSRPPRKRSFPSEIESIASITLKNVLTLGVAQSLLQSLQYTKRHPQGSL